MNYFEYLGIKIYLSDFKPKHWLFFHGNEFWKDVIGYEGLYQVSIFGRVKRMAGSFSFGKWDIKTSIITIPERFIKIQVYKNDGYTYATLSNGSVAKKKKIHRLVAEAFIPNPNNYPQVNHIDAVRNNGKKLNLEWCTQSHNMKHKFKIGNQSNAGEKNAMAKLVLNTETGIYYGSLKDAADYHNIKLTKLYDNFRHNKPMQFIYA